MSGLVWKLVAPSVRPPDLRDPSVSEKHYRVNTYATATAYTTQLENLVVSLADSESRVVFVCECVHLSNLNIV